MADVAEHVVCCTFDADHLQGAGNVQGGVVAGAIGDIVHALADAAIGRDRVAELETLDIAFERPVAPGTVTVVATLTRRGRTMMAWEARMIDAAGKTVATARTTHRLVAAPA